MSVTSCVMFRSLLTTLKYRSFSTAAAAAASTTVQFPQFSSAAEMAQYTDSQVSSMDPLTLAKFLKYAHTTTSYIPDGREFRMSPSLKKAVSQAVKLANTDDEALLAQLLNGVSAFAPNRKFMATQQHLKDAGESFLSLVTLKKVKLSSAHIAFILQCLCKLDAKNLELCNFIKEQLPQHIPQMSPGACRTTLRVLHDMDIRDPQLSKLVHEKLIESMDDFKNEDVIGTLYTFAYTGFIVPAAMRHCVDLLSQHTSLFDPNELISASEALMQLQNFPLKVSSRICEEIQKRVRSLRIPELSRLLNILCAFPKPDAHFANEIIGTLASSPAPKAIGVEANMAYAICTFGLHERKQLLQDLVNNLLSAEVLTPMILGKLVEIVESAKYDLNMTIKIPPNFQNEIDALHIRRKPMAPLWVKDLFEKLPEKFKLSLESEVRLGPFAPSFADQKNKIAIEVLSEGMGTRLRSHLYDKLGYSFVAIKLRRLRSAKIEAHQLELLQNALGAAMVKIGRITVNELAAIREAQKTAREM